MPDILFAREFHCQCSAGVLMKHNQMREGEEARLACALLWERCSCIEAHTAVLHLYFMLRACSYIANACVAGTLDAGSGELPAATDAST